MWLGATAPRARTPPHFPSGRLPLHTTRRGLNAWSPHTYPVPKMSDASDPEHCPASGDTIKCREELTRREGNAKRGTEDVTSDDLLNQPCI